jgi:hypothetical protein
MAMRANKLTAAVDNLQLSIAERAMARPQIPAFRTFVDDQVGALQRLTAFSKVDDQATLGICADQKVFQIPPCAQTALQWQEKRELVALS